MQDPPLLVCVLYLCTGRGWQKTFSEMSEGIEGLQYSLDTPNQLMFLKGHVDPLIFVKNLCKARHYALLLRLDYGYEKNPQGPRKPNSHIMRLRFELNTLEKAGFKKLIGALKTIQAVSCTVDGPTQEAYLQGNIENNVLMKMLKKTRIVPRTIDYGPTTNDPPPKKVEAPANVTQIQPAFVTQTQPAKVTDPPPQDASDPPSTKIQVTHKKTSSIRRFFGFH